MNKELADALRALQRINLHEGKKADSELLKKLGGTVFRGGQLTLDVGRTARKLRLEESVVEKALADQFQLVIDYAPADFTARGTGNHAHRPPETRDGDGITGVQTPRQRFLRGRNIGVKLSGRGDS